MMIVSWQRTKRWNRRWMCVLRILVKQRFLFAAFAWKWICWRIRMKSENYSRKLNVLVDVPEDLIYTQKICSVLFVDWYILYYENCRCVPGSHVLRKRAGPTSNVDLWLPMLTFDFPCWLLTSGVNFPHPLQMIFKFRHCLSGSDRC